MTALENLRISSHSGHKGQLVREMQREREQRQKKLVKALDGESVAELRKRLKRAALDAQVPNEVEPLVLAQQLFAEMDKDRAPLTEKRLHQYRLLGKRVRYVAEFAGASVEAKQFVEKLKRMQDAIGDWHDWLELSGRAEELFGRAHDSSLVAVLQNLTRAKFRQAVRVLTETRQWMEQQSLKTENAATAPRKPSTHTTRTSAGNAAGAVA
jgi:CHAD domain-containing protein